jgi:hypothetical protein
MLDAVCYSMGFLMPVWLIEPYRQSSKLRAPITFWYIFPCA